MSDRERGMPADPPLTLIQIEEPREAAPEFTDPGLVMALELTDAGLGVAVAVGGNAATVATVPPSAERIDGADGRAAPMGDMMRDARRITMQRTQRLVVRAVCVVAPGLGLAGRQDLLRAADAAGLDLLACIERPVALAHGIDLARFGAGVYLLVDAHHVAALAVRGGQIRLAAFGDRYDAVRAEAPSPVRGVVLVGDAAAPDPDLPVLDRVTQGDAALLGAALLGEDLG